MPYDAISDLPKEQVDQYSTHQKHAFLEAFNSALDEYKVTGVRTTIPVLARVIAHEDFRAWRLSTQLLERILPQLTPSGGKFESIALIAAALAEYERVRRPAAASSGNGGAAASGDPAACAPATTQPSAWRLGVRPGWRTGGR